MQYLISIWEMAAEAAPWLLFGLIAAAVVKALVPTRWISSQLGSSGFGSVIKGSVVGIPLPLCSCGVLPTALGLRRQGAGKPATVSFLVSTPEIGLDSFLLSFALLGPFMAIARPIAAFFSAVLAGSMALLTDRKTSDVAGAPAPAPAPGDAPTSASSSCCSGKKPTPAASSCCSSHADAKPPAKSCCCQSSADEKTAASDCCSSHQSTEPQTHGCCSSHDQQRSVSSPGVFARLADGLKYVFTTLWDDIKLWLAVAVIVAGLAMAFTGGQPAQFLQQWGSGPVAMLIMLMVGIPLYICATASTPIAAALLASGVSPGTVLVLLLAGPATNLGSIAILRKELGTPVLLAYLFSIAAASMAAGLITDAVVQHWHINIAAQVEHSSHLMPHWFGTVAAVILITLAIKPLRNLLFTGRIAPSKPADDHADHHAHRHAAHHAGSSHDTPASSAGQSCCCGKSDSAESAASAHPPHANQPSCH